MESENIIKKFQKLVDSSTDYRHLIERSLELIYKYSRAYPSEMKIVIDDLLRKVLAQNDTISLAKCYYFRGWTFLDTGDYHAALDDFKKSLEIFQENKDIKGVISSLNSMGYSYTCIGSPGEALNKYNEALQMAADQGKQDQLPLILGNMGELFLDLKLYPDALHYFKKVFEMIEEPTNKAITLGRIGYVNNLMGNNEKALTYLYEGLQLAESEDIPGVKTEILMSLGSTYKGLNDWDKADEMLSRAIEQAREIKLPRVEAESSLMLGQILMNRGQIENAAVCFESALNLAVSIKAFSIEIDALRNISLVFKEKGLWKEAYKCLMEYHSKMQEILSMETAKQIDHIKMSQVLKEAEFFKKVYDQISFISQIGREITSSLDLKKIVLTTYEKIQGIMDAPVLGLGFYSMQDKEINYRFFIETNAWIKPFKSNIDQEDTLGGWCIKNRKEIIINDLDEEFSQYIKSVLIAKTENNSKVNSLVYLPLVKGDKTIGVLSVQSYQINAYADYQVEAFKALASYISIAIENAQLYEDVQKLANEDPLTSLINRNSFYAQAKKELTKYKRYGETFSLILFDLDNFKEINDQWGHAAGDITLIEVANHCKAAIRSIDLFCRFGGEEFIILLPSTKSDGAYLLAERIRKGLEGLKIAVNDNQLVNLSASFGVTTVKEEDRVLSDAIKRVDQAMYMSKKMGKNLITSKD